MEVEYPIPKKCIVCRDKFYVGMKIKRASNSLNNYYNEKEKKIILYYLNQLFPNDITYNIIKFLKNIIIFNFGHFNCCRKENRNITWCITSKKDMIIEKCT